MNSLPQVAILGHNSPEWFSSSVGAVLAGGVVRTPAIVFSPYILVFFSLSSFLQLLVHQATGVYTTNTTDAVLYQLKHSKVHFSVLTRSRFEVD